jgi:uncharacterized protein (UPF0548 family)
VGKTARVSDLTYAPVGATRTGPLPPGFRHLHYRLYLGTGTDLYERAGEAVLTFAMHRATGLPVRTEAARAEPGVRLTVGEGPLRVPCEVVWSVQDQVNTGWGYGTRPGHQASGEEAFLVRHDDQDRVWFSVTAYSRPARLPMLLAGPLAVVAQRTYARRCGHTLRRICTVNS